MKLLFFDDWKLGVLKGDSVVDVSAVVTGIPHTGPHNLISGLIERFADHKVRLEEAVSSGQGVPVGSVRIRPPLPEARQHRGDGRELHGGRHALGACADQCLPQVPPCRHRARRHDGAARRARHHLRGRGRDGPHHRQARGERPRRGCDRATSSAIATSSTAPRGDCRPPGNTFYQMKSRDTFAPIGPYLVTADEIADPHRLDIRLWVNGELQAELQHQRHGPQDPPLHRVGDLHPYLEPGDMPGHGTEPPRPQRVSERRHGRARDAGAGPVAVQRAGRSQADLGAGDTARPPEQGLDGTTPQLSGKYTTASDMAHRRRYSAGTGSTYGKYASPAALAPPGRWPSRRRRESSAQPVTATSRAACRRRSGCPSCRSGPDRPRSEAARRSSGRRRCRAPRPPAAARRGPRSRGRRGRRCTRCGSCHG